MTSVNYPVLKNIIGISNALNAVVTFGSSHDFTLGEIVSFRVSKNYGMKEINNKQARVIGVGSTDIIVEIDTNTWTPFVYPPITSLISPLQFIAVCIPSASGIIPGSYPSTINLRDSFDRVRTI